MLLQIYQTLTECVSYTYGNLTMFLKNSKGDSTASHNIPFKCSPLSPLSSSTYLKPASCSLIGIVFILILPKWGRWRYKLGIQCLSSVTKYSRIKIPQNYLSLIPDNIWKCLWEHFVIVVVVVDDDVNSFLFYFY